MNRDRDYPTVNLLRLRLLQFRTEPTGLGIRPKGREPEPPPEVVHDNATVIPAISHGVLHVLEWSDDGRLDRHRAELFTERRRRR